MDRNHRILIIDDNKDNLKVAANILKQENRTIWVAVSGENGIEIAKTKNPDIILLDIQMPEMDGIETCKKLKEDEATKNIPVIFMTARTDDESIREAFEAGGVDYITKPIKIHEVTARVNTHLNLVEKIEELNNTIAIKDKFFSIIAHDLKGPISAIALLFEMVSEDIESFNVEELKDIMKGTGDSARRTYNLLMNLLEWSKTQTGMIRFETEEINLKKLIEDNIEIVKMLLQEKKIKINSRIFGEPKITADYNMLSTIIRNLISNAVKFTNVEGEIEVGTEISDNILSIYVQDNGVGMSENIKNKLFKIEEKIISEGTIGEKGTGLGLVLVKEFVTKHGWDIKVESEQGKGSRFTIIILN